MLKLLFHFFPNRRKPMKLKRRSAEELTDSVILSVMRLILFSWKTANIGLTTTSPIRRQTGPYGWGLGPGVLSSKLQGVQSLRTAVGVVRAIKSNGNGTCSTIRHRIETHISFSPTNRATSCGQRISPSGMQR